MWGALDGVVTPLYNDVCVEPRHSHVALMATSGDSQTDARMLCLEPRDLAWVYDALSMTGVACGSVLW